MIELSEKAKLKSDNLLNALRDIENKLDEIRKQNGELRGAFREIDRIKSILSKHPARENEQIDEKVSAAIEYFESIRSLLNMVDTRIDKIQPKIQQFFGSLNRRFFDTKVEKFLVYLLTNSKIISGETVLPLINESFNIQLPGTNFSIIENREGLSRGVKNSPVTYAIDREKETAAYQQSRVALLRQNNINIWLEKIRRESLHESEYHLSDIFFNILEVHNEDLHLAVNVIYQAIDIYDKHDRWRIEIDKDIMIQVENHNYSIWDIWMKLK